MERFSEFTGETTAIKPALPTDPSTLYGQAKSAMADGHIHRAGDVLSLILNGRQDVSPSLKAQAEALMSEVIRLTVASKPLEQLPQVQNEVRHIAYHALSPQGSIPEKSALPPLPSLPQFVTAPLPESKPEPEFLSELAPKQKSEIKKKREKQIESTTEKPYETDDKLGEKFGSGADIHTEVVQALARKKIRLSKEESVAARIFCEALRRKHPSEQVAATLIAMLSSLPASPSKTLLQNELVSTLSKRNYLVGADARHVSEHGINID